MSIIEINNLSKSYGKTKALDNVSFNVERGELFGLIGPDGAGKTTLFRLLTTLLTPEEGSATVDGRDIVKDYLNIRSAVGYMPGRFSLYPDLTVEENLEFFAALFGVTIKESYDLIAPIYRQIEPFRKRRACINPHPSFPINLILIIKTTPLLQRQSPSSLSTPHPYSSVNHHLIINTTPLL